MPSRLAADVHLRGQLVLLAPFVAALMPEPARVMLVFQPFENLTLLRGFHQALPCLLHLFFLSRELLHQLLAAEGNLCAVACHRADLVEIDAADEVPADLTFRAVNGLLHLAQLLFHGLGLLLHVRQLALALALGAAALLKDRFILEGEAGHSLCRCLTAIYDRKLFFI